MNPLNIKFPDEKAKEAREWLSALERVYVDTTKCSKEELLLSINSEYKDYDTSALPPFEQMREFYIDTIKQTKVLSADGMPYINSPMLMGIGASGLVVQKTVAYNKEGRDISMEPVLYKFSKNAEKDFYYLKKIYDATEGNPKRIPKLIEKLCIKDKDNIIGVAMEGDFAMLPLEFFGIVKTEKYIKLSYELTQTLIEIRNVGIEYHRDINPRNVLVFAYCMAHDFSMKTKLIDFEYATEDKTQARREGNRRFWGPNDLNSLGSTIYYASTDNILFSSITSKERDLSDIADHIYTQSKKAYANPSGPEMRNALYKINNHCDDKLAEIITALILAKDSDHEKILQICEKNLYE